MWPFQRKQKISSKELTNYIAICTIDPDYDRPLLFKKETKLPAREHLFEVNILAMTTMEIAIRHYFKHNQSKCINLLTYYYIYCNGILVATNIISDSFDFMNAFIVRYNQYITAFNEDQDGAFCAVGRKMCQYFLVSNTDVAYYLPAIHVFVTKLKADDEFISGIMKDMYKIDESSDFRFDPEYLRYIVMNRREK
jgi:hypothetical protein